MYCYCSFIILKPIIGFKGFEKVLYKWTKSFMKMASSKLENNHNYGEKCENSLISTFIDCTSPHFQKLEYDKH